MHNHNLERYNKKLHSPEQLNAQLHQKLNSCYLLVGHDPLLLQESQDTVLRFAHKHGFNEHLHLTFNKNNTNWNEIINHFNTPSLFSRQRTILLKVPEDKGFRPKVSDRLLKLIKLLHDEILLIIIIPYLTKEQEESYWFALLSQNSVVVHCFTPDKFQLPQWVSQRANAIGLRIEEKAIHFLCYNYENNLLALVQTLNMLVMLWPDDLMTLQRLTRLVNDVAHFTNIDWVDAILEGKSKRTLHILHQLRITGSPINLLCYRLQRDLMTVLTLQRKITPAPFILEQIDYKRRIPFTEAIQRLNYQRIKLAICLLARMELALQKEHKDTLFWCQIEKISLLLSDPRFPESLAHL
ncbi:MAG: DNA polymerase III subunit delta [Candidatus Dasytiphilus stammeri]